jgi:ABC-type sugar transport system permease subunit
MSERFWKFQQKYAPYFFVAPFVVLFAVFLLYPLERSIVLSFYKAVNVEKMRFAGLENYTFLIHDLLFWGAVLNTALYAVCFLCLQIPISLGLALLLNSKLVVGRNFFRFAFFAPALVGSVFVAVIFGLMLAQRHGPINKAIGALLPWVGTETNWLGNPKLAMPAILIASLWISVGYPMIYFLAALQSVDKELYEAASVDGAGKWSQFWNVTLPGIWPVVVFMILVGTIGAFQLFELPYVLFQGPGPNGRGMTIVMYLFMMGINAGDLGYASAVAWGLVVIIFVLSLIQLRLTGAARRDKR